MDELTDRGFSIQVALEETCLGVDLNMGDYSGEPARSSGRLHVSGGPNAHILGPLPHGHLH
jgi:hypothetical protein